MMKKLVLLAAVGLMCLAVVSEAAPKKIALVGRISWCPGSEGSTTDRDFDVMPHFSMDDENLRRLVDSWGYYSVLMVDYVVQLMLNNGEVPFPPGDDADYSLYVNDGLYMAQPNFFQDNGYELIWVTGTCWSSIAPPLKNVPIPVIQGEHVCLGSRSSKIGSIFMFDGEQSGDHNGVDKIVLTAEGKAHPIMADFPDEIAVFGDGPNGPPQDPGQAWNGLHDVVANAAEGTKVLAVWADNPEQAAVAVIEKDAKLADGTPAPARRVMVFFNGGQVRPINEAELPPVWVISGEYFTAEGKELLRRCVRWALGEPAPAPVAKWQMK
jgi:hypothetical protein